MTRWFTTPLIGPVALQADAFAVGAVTCYVYDGGATHISLAEANEPRGDAWPRSGALAERSAL